MRPFRRRRGDEQPQRGSVPGRLPWEPREDDVGIRIVDMIGHSLSLDAQWSIRDGRGFTWWGKDLAQRVWSEPGVDDDGFEIFRLHARTDLFQDFEPTDDNLIKLNLLGLHATMSGYLVDGDARTVQLAASMFAHAEIESQVCRMFKLVVATQAADAQVKAENLAEPLGLTAAATGHPSSGVRVEADDMLTVLERVAAAGEHRSSWEGDGVDRTIQMLEGQPNVMLVEGRHTGLRAGFLFQSTSILKVGTESSHPQLGNGVLLLLQLALDIGERDGVRFAAELTRRELQSPWPHTSKSHYLGCWCWADGIMYYVTFLPNIMHMGGPDLFNIISSMGLRAKWVAETFYGDEWDESRDPVRLPPRVLAILEALERQSAPGSR